MRNVVVATHRGTYAQTSARNTTKRTHTQRRGAGATCPAPPHLYTPARAGTARRSAMTPCSATTHARLPGTACHRAHNDTWRSNIPNFTTETQRACACLMPSASSSRPALPCPATGLMAGSHAAAAKLYHDRFTRESVAAQFGQHVLARGRDYLVRSINCAASRARLPTCLCGSSRTHVQPHARLTRTGGHVLCITGPGAPKCAISSVCGVTAWRRVARTVPRVHVPALQHHRDAGGYSMLQWRQERGCGDAAQLQLPHCTHGE